jgi:regulator of sirC expression with transglutaminase-like and TPR domain
MVTRPETQIDLMAAALTIARTAYPDLDAAESIAHLDEWAKRLGQRLGDDPSAGDILAGLNRILFAEEGFDGERENYFDPQNSFLNRVIVRRRGIPITLSLVYCEVGRRAGFALSGISLPGHFIAGLFHTSGMLYVDPFNQGEILSEDECYRLVSSRYGETTTMNPDWLRPVGKRMILARMLRNLKAIYRHRNRTMQMLEMIQWILTVDPDSAVELRERGLIYADMGNAAFAVQDLSRYLEVHPDAPDRESIAETIRRMNASGQRLH